MRRGLNAVAKQLSRASPDDANPLNLSVELVPNTRPLKLRCILTNVSSESVHIRKPSLPCVGWWSLNVRGLTVDGRFLPMRPPLALGDITSVHPPEITISPGDTIVNELSLESVYPLRETPRNVDVLLLWSYSHGHFINSGITLLPRKRP